MHQNDFVSSPDVFLGFLGFLGFFKNMFLMVWKYAKMLQHTFFTTSDGKK
jgi:hypothetical protein